MDFPTYKSLSRSVIETIKSRNEWGRVISIDLETKIEKKEDFLTNECILVVEVARRTNEGIKTGTFKQINNQRR